MKPIPTWQSAFDPLPSLRKDPMTASLMMQAEIDALRTRLAEVAAMREQKPEPGRVFSEYESQTFKQMLMTAAPGATLPQPG